MLMSSCICGAYVRSGQRVDRTNMKGQRPLLAAVMPAQKTGLTLDVLRFPGGPLKKRPQQVGHRKSDMPPASVAI